MDKFATCHDKKLKLPESWWLMKPLLTDIEQVDSKVNTNQIWDDPSIMNDYIRKKQ